MVSVSENLKLLSASVFLYAELKMSIASVFELLSAFDDELDEDELVFLETVLLFERDELPFDTLTDDLVDRNSSANALTFDDTIDNVLDDTAVDALDDAVDDAADDVADDVTDDVKDDATEDAADDDIDCTVEDAIFD